MRRDWSTCSTCGKSFVARLSYQTQVTAEGTKYYCSLACRKPQLRRRSPGPVQEKAPAPEAQHQCIVCSKRFSLVYAYQVVTLGKRRKVVCSKECRETLLQAYHAQTSKPQKVPPKTIAVLNQKGGTGKTTTAISLAAGLAAKGKRTLLVDLDAQGNVAVSLGAKNNRTLYHILVDGLSPKDALVPIRQNLDLLIADQGLAAAEIELVNAPDRAKLLQRRLADVVAEDSPYSYIILDCAPALSILNQNALVFAKHVLIPVACDYLSLVGVKQVLRTIKHVKDVLLAKVEIACVLPTLYDRRNRIATEALESLIQYFGDKVSAPIRMDVRLKEAPSHKQTIFEYAPESGGAADYGKLVDFIEHTMESASTHTSDTPQQECVS